VAWVDGVDIEKCHEPVVFPELGAGYHPFADFAEDAAVHGDNLKEWNKKASDETQGEPLGFGQHVLDTPQLEEAAPEGSGQVTQ